MWLHILKPEPTPSLCWLPMGLQLLIANPSAQTMALLGKAGLDDKHRYACCL